MKSISIFSRTTKFGFAALFGIAIASSSYAAKYTTMTDLGGNTVSITLTSDQTIKDVFSSGAGITNGTLNVKYPSGVWGTISGLNFTIAKDAILNFNTTKTGNVKDGELNIKNGSVVTLDGGIFNNNNSRTSDYNDIGNDGSDGTLRIINGGKFIGTKTSLQIGNKQGSTGIVSVDDGTVDVGSHYIYVAPNQDAGYPNTTGILAVTNGVVKANKDIALCEKNSGIAKLSFVDSELTISRIRKNKDPASGSFCIMDGCTVNSSYGEMLSNIKIPYQLEGKGLIANPSVDSVMYGYYTARMTFRGNAPIIKTGDKTLKISGVLDGTNGSDGTTGVTDYQVLGGVLDISGGTYLPIEQLNLTAKTGGRFEGGIGSDLTDSYNSLTVDGTVTIPIVFGEDGCTKIKAKTLILDTTSENPVTLDCSGSFVEGVSYCIRENLPEDDVAKLKVTGLDAKLIYRDGNLYAEPNQRANGTVVWQGGSGDNWWDANKWLLDASLTTFVNGDAVVFNAENVASVTLDDDALVSGLYVTNDVTITGAEKTLTTPVIDVTDGVTATIAASLGEDIAKRGAGELVLQDYTSGKAVDLKEGKVTLSWTDEKKDDPFSTAKDANAVAGVLDLGGATQNVKSSLAEKGTGVLRDGGVLLNGKLIIDPSDDAVDNWWRLENTTFTVGMGATLEISKTTNQDGEMGFFRGACLVIDGGRVNALNGRGGNSGAYLGCDYPGVNTIRIQNGGVFYEPNQFLRVGYNGGGTGILSVDGGTVDLGGQELRIACAANTTGIFAMTNGTLTANDVCLCESSSCPATFILSTNSTAKIGQIKKNHTPADGSTVLFDGATLVPTAEGSFLPDLGIEATIGANGLIISNDYDVTVAAPLTGEGKFVKMGKGSLTLNGVQTNYTGNIEVAEGTFGFGSDVTFAAVETPTRTLTVAGGTTVDVGYSAEGGFAGTEHFLLKPTGEGKINLTITASTLPMAGKYYPIFAGTFDETITNRLEIMAGYALEVQDGKLVVSVAPRTVKWSGEDPSTDAWSSAMNWGNEEPPVAVDTVKFDSEGGETTYDLENGLAFQLLDVACGAWTTKVDQASFANTPLALAQGASFALTDAEGRTNPFSTAKDAVQIAGTLNLGGGSQTLVGQLADNNSGSFRNGGTIENGKFTLGSSDVIQLHNVAFTIGTNANVSSTSLFNMGGNGYLKIDGGSFSTSGSSNLSDAGSYIGNYGNATIEILNGSFSHTKERLYIGRAHKKAGNGAIYGINAKIDLGGYELIMGDKNKSTSTLMLTNSTLTCKCIQFGLNGSSSPGKQKLEFVGSTLKLGQFAVKKVASGSSVAFDGATIVDNGKATALLTDLGIPYTIAEGGLTVKVANKDGDDDYVSFPGTFEGEGDFILVAAGKTPREARFSGVAEKGFTGNLIVSNGVTVVAGDRTFKGGLYACEGSTLDVATSIFEGDITLEDGVKFATEGVTMKEHMTKGVLVAKTKGKITLPEGSLHDQNTRNGAYIVEKNGYSELYYGRKPGLVFVIH